MTLNTKINNLSYSLKFRNTYKYIFCLFYISGLFKCPKARAGNKNTLHVLLKFLNILFNPIIHTFELLLCISKILYSGSKNIKKGIVFAFICIAYSSFRIYLLANYNEYKKIIKHISLISCTVGHKQSVPRSIIL